MTENLQQLFIERENLMNQAKNFLDTHSDESGKIAKDSAKEFEKLERHIESLTLNIDRELSKPSGMKPLLNYPQNNFGGAFGAGENYHEKFFNQVRQNFHDARNVLTESPSDSGSYLLPTEFHDELIKKLEEENILRKISRVITTQNDRKIAISTGTTSASFVAEGATIPLQDLEFAQKTLSAYKLAAATAISNELLQDSAFDLESFLSDEFAAAIGRAEENALFNGDGIDQPLGLIEILNVNSDTSITQTVGANIAADDILNLVYKLPRVYRKNAVFLANDSTIATLRKLKTADLQYIWQPAMTADEPDRLFGYQIFSSEFMPNIGAGQTCLLFGDFSKFFIGERGQASFKALHEIRALNDESVFLLTSRFDGILADVHAMRGLRVKA